MKFDNELKTFVLKAVKMANKLGISNLILDNICLRGATDTGVMIIDPTIPTLPFNDLGIPRVDVLASRLALMDEDDLDISYVTKERDGGEEYVYRLVLISGTTRVEFRCGNATKFGRIPKKIKNEIFYEITIPKESIELMNRATRGFKSETIRLVGSKNGLIAQCSDIEGDEFKHVVTDEIFFTPACDERKFKFSYNMRDVVSNLKRGLDQNDSLEVNISKMGFLVFPIDGIQIWIAPER